ncbi:hypothetical protein C8Q80DRAFT_1137420 [Daedaleopsis nitida]|nr:hypothetical protein C8Q80DRAFT_1137420 [Daedaleopsis nitida]
MAPCSTSYVWVQSRGRVASTATKFEGLSSGRGANGQNSKDTTPSRGSARRAPVSTCVSAALTISWVYPHDAPFSVRHSIHSNWSTT